MPSSVEWLVHETSEFRDDEIYYRMCWVVSLTWTLTHNIMLYYVFQIDYVLGSLLKQLVQSHVPVMCSIHEPNTCEWDSYT